MLGRPNAIQDAYTSTQPPSNVEDEITLAEIRNPPPLHTPTRITFVILRHILASIIGKIVHHFQQVRQHSHYSDVLGLDDELMKFIRSLPPHFALKPDTSLDDSLSYIPAHRFLLITEVLFVRISLHRPYLLRRLSSDRYLRSRQACFESAEKDYEIRNTFQEKIPQGTRDSLHSAYREFQSAMISGIYLVLEPNGHLAETMHAIMDSFLRDHDGVREMDETTRRELKIIEFLKIKASQVQEGSVHGSAPPDNSSTPSSSGPATDAQLLLGIQRPSSRTPYSFALSPPKIHSPLSLAMPTIRQASAETASPLTNNVLPTPALQRVQQQSDQSDGQNTSKSGSPNADDELSTAQSLLDHWLGFSSGAVNSDPSVDGSAGLAGLPWGGFGSADLSGWFGSTSPVVGNEPNPSMPSLDGLDWSYWETLVNEIRGGPSQAGP